MFRVRTFLLYFVGDIFTFPVVDFGFLIWFRVEVKLMRCAGEYTEYVGRHVWKANNMWSLLELPFCQTSARCSDLCWLLTSWLYSQVFRYGTVISIHLSSPELTDHIWHIWLSMFGPATSWQSAHGIPCFSSGDSWNQLQSPETLDRMRSGMYFLFTNV